MSVILASKSEKVLAQEMLEKIHLIIFQKKWKVEVIKKYSNFTNPTCLAFSSCLQYLCCGRLNFVLNQWHCITYLSASGLTQHSVLFCLDSWFAPLENKEQKYMIQGSFALKSCKDLPLSTSANWSLAKIAHSMGFYPRRIFLFSKFI